MPGDELQQGGVGVVAHHTGIDPDAVVRVHDPRESTERRERELDPR